MFFAMVLAASSAITPTLSEAADTLARAYFTNACTDGKERYGVVTVDDLVLHELTVDSATHTATIDEAAFKPLCQRSPLIAYHCHTTHDRLSLFPGIVGGARDSDFGTAAYLEYLCAVETPIHPVIEHRLVHTGGKGSVVAFGIRGVPRERARSLGTRMAKLSAQSAPPTSAYGIQDWSIISTLPKRMQEVMADLDALYTSLRIGYQDELFAFIRRACPDVETADQLNACDGLTVEAFIKSRGTCRDAYIAVPDDPALSTCVPSVGERITIGGPRHPGWAELTPKTYDAFTATGRSAVAFCSDTEGFDAARPCAVVLEELAHVLPDCGQLRRGFVDVARHAELIDRHDARFREVILIEEGRRYVINNTHLSSQMVTLVMCGPEVLFGTNPFN